MLKSMERSRDLTRGSRFKIILLYIVFFLLSTLLSLLLSFLAGQVPAIPFLATVGEVFGGAIAGILTALIGASLYIELRTVKEGADFRHLTDVFA